MRAKALVLLSSGLDSLAALSQAVQDYDVVLALTFDYGQRAAQRELGNSGKIAKFYGIKHQKIKLDWFRKIINTSLVNKKRELPKLSKASQGNKQTAKSVWVPNRNGLFLNIAAAYAESFGAQVIITGFNQEEAATFPDNSLAFCQEADKFFSYSTANKVKVKNYFSKKNKKQILRLALANGAPLEFVWPCYEGGWQICGKCESCVRFGEAINSLTPEELKHL